MHSLILSQEAGVVDGDDVPVAQRCDVVSEDVDHVDLPGGVTPLHKFIWRAGPLRVGDYIDELDSGSRDLYGFRVACTPHKWCFTFLVVTMVRQVRVYTGICTSMYGYMYEYVRVYVRVCTGIYACHTRSA